LQEQQMQGGVFTTQKELGANDSVTAMAGHRGALCLFYLGPHRRRRPHISMDTFPRHSGYCKVSTTHRLVMNVLKI